MVLVCSPAHVDGIIASAPEARGIGEVVKGRGKEQVIVS